MKQIAIVQMIATMYNENWNEYGRNMIEGEEKSRIAKRWSFGLQKLNGVGTHCCDVVLRKWRHTGPSMPIPSIEGHYAMPLYNRERRERPSLAVADPAATGEAFEAEKIERVRQSVQTSVLN